MAMKDLSTETLQRPSPAKTEAKEQEMDSYFDQIERKPPLVEKNGQVSETPVSASTSQTSSDPPQNPGMEGAAAAAKIQTISETVPAKSATTPATTRKSGETPLNKQEKGTFDLNTIADSPVELEGEVVRNFKIKKINMNRVKELTVRTQNAGHKVTQDDIINRIIEDWFKNKSL